MLFEAKIILLCFVIIISLTIIGEKNKEKIVKKTIQFLLVIFYLVLLKKPVFLGQNAARKSGFTFRSQALSLLCSDSSPLLPSQASQRASKTVILPSVNFSAFSFPHWYVCICCLLLVGFITMQIVLQPFLCFIAQTFPVP